MKLTLLLVLALGIGGCVESTPPTAEEITAKKVEAGRIAAARTQRVKNMASACDRNDGVKDVEQLWTGGRFSSRYAERVICNDGMSREFPL